MFNFAKHLSPQTVSLCLTALAILATAAAGNGQEAAPEQPFVKCWEIPTATRLVTEPVTDNGTVFLAELGGVVRAVDSHTGGTLWVTELGGNVVSNLLVDDGRVFAVTTPVGANGDSQIRAIDAGSGVVGKTARVEKMQGGFLMPAEARIIVVSDGGRVVSFSKDLSSTHWSVAAGGKVVGRPDIGHGRVAAAFDSGRLIMLDLADGREVLNFPVEAKPTGVVAVGPESVIAGDVAGNIFRLEGGKVVWSLKTGASISHLLHFGDEGVVAASLDNFVYLIDPKSGRVQWRKRNAGRITHRPLSTDRYLFSAAVGESQVQVTDSAGKSVNVVELGEGNYVVQAPAISIGGYLIVTMPDAIAAFSNASCGK